MGAFLKDGKKGRSAFLRPTSILTTQIDTQEMPGIRKKSGELLLGNFSILGGAIVMQEQIVIDQSFP